jgi:probable lipoprotein
MKNFKRILLAVVAVFAAVLLVACGAKSDNGTYVYKPSKTEVKEILGEQGASDSTIEAVLDQVKLEVTVTIKDKKGSLSIKGEAMGNKMDQSYEVKVDQKAKTFQSKTGDGEKIKYKVSGDVFTFDLSGEESKDHAAALEMFKNAKFKRTK